MTVPLATPARRRNLPQRQSMRIAAIDIGSNSIHMVVAEADVNGGISTLWRMREMIGLGKASFTSHSITREAVDRAMAALARFVAAAQQRQCEKIVAVATSAVREATNGGDFVHRVARKFGIDVRVISGREEARLIYLGVKHAMPLAGGPHVIIDVGGGSLELIVADQRHAMLLESRKLGASRMTAAFVKSDPISPNDQAALLAHYAKELEPICEQIREHRVVKAIGTSGTLETIAMLCNPDAGNNGEHKPLTIERPAFDCLLPELLESDHKHRAQMPRLDPGRADQIVAGALLIDELLRRLRIRRIHLCKSALREGLLIDYLSRHLPELAIRQQVPQPRMRSVIALARRCAWHKHHSEHVARLCMRLFDETRALHNLGTPERELIEYGALLHDIGWHIGRTAHHKHSMYLIQHGDLKSFTGEEVSIIANIARYHRKSPPKEKHLAFAKLAPRARAIVRVGAALLRIADGLDRSHATVVRELKCRVGQNQVKCVLNARWDAQLEIWAATRKSGMFEKVFKKSISFEVAR